MTGKFSRNSYLSVAVPFIEAAPPQQPSREELRAVREAELRAATREHEAELLAIFDRLPKWNTVEGGQGALSLLERAEVGRVRLKRPTLVGG
jgi:hypothetical protein